MPNRHGSSSAYRYGFQGQEKDDELKGEGNSLNYTFRMHDPRVGRFFARDPLEAKFPFYSPYQFSSNTPISAVELEGLETSDNKNKNEEPSVGDRILLGFVQIFNDISKLTGHHKYDNNTPEGYIANSARGVQGLYDITFKVMGTYELARFGIGSLDVDNQTSFSLSKTFGSIKKNAFNFSIPKITLPPLSTLLKAPNLVDTKKSLAKTFLGKYGVANIERHLRAIHFEEPVYTKVLDVGTKLYRWSRKGTTDAKHYFSTSKGFHPTEAGLQSSLFSNPSDWEFEEFTLTKKIKALHSTVDLDGEKGVQQVFSTQIESNSTSKVVTPEF